MTYLDKMISLTPMLKNIICDKATESPYSGQYNTIVNQGTYLCRRCGLALFRAKTQFHSGCGWPSFDEAITDHVNHLPDSDGLRTEIICTRCTAHLGHVFQGEHFTSKNLRHCVNATSLDFVVDNKVFDSEEALVAGGCFWGVDYYMRCLHGVLKVEVGYSGGHLHSPHYMQVCQGNTGHFETVRILYDKEKTNYTAVLKRFFETHDPTQANGQGPDIGSQYQSAVFYYNEIQLQEAKALIQELIKRDYDVKTVLLPAQIFWPAGDYHQDYYIKHRKYPYCHRLVHRFG
jgi:peptide methionine sulfoxide reductase msrA/msrB